MAPRVAEAAKFQTLSLSGYQCCEGCKGCNVLDFFFFEDIKVVRVARVAKFQT